MSGEAIVAAARAMLGAPFRLHGRAADGVDCVGLVAAALGQAAGTAYGLRSADAARAAAALARAGLRRVTTPAPGDVALARPGPLQLHLMIWTGAGFVHAHAGLGRVVETPGDPGWPILSWWRPI